MFKALLYSGMATAHLISQILDHPAWLPFLVALAYFLMAACEVCHCRVVRRFTRQWKRNRKG